MKNIKFEWRKYSLLLLFNATVVFGFSQPALPSSNADTSFTPKNSSNTTIAKGFKPFILPAAMITYGALALELKPLKNLNHYVQREIVTNNPNFSTHADDYLWMVPTAAVYGLNFAGLKGKHSYRDLTVIVLISNGIMEVGSQITKKSVHELRPDGGDYESFPSGHTASAFTAAEYLYQEYKDVSPWIGVGGYAVATATGVLRLYNNKHYLGDVVAGAGLGILSTKIAYTVYPFVARHLFKNYSFKTVALPAYIQENPGFSLVHHFNWSLQKMRFPQLSKFLLILFLPACFSASAQNNTLQFYQEQALQNSPLLKDYQNQVVASRIDSMRIRASYKPQVNASSSAFIAPVVRGFGYDGSVTNIQTFDALLNVNQSLDSKRYIRAQLRTLGLESDSIRNTSKISEQDLKRSVIGQYVTAYGSLQQLQFNQQVNALLSKEEKILKKLTQQNVYRQSDYLTFLVTLQQQNLQLSQSKIQFQNDFATLNYLSGIVDTTAVQLQDPQLSTSILPPLATSIFFKQYGLDSLKLLNNRQLLDFAYRPRASVFANGGYNTAFIAPIYNNFGTAFGFTLAVPIYDGGQRKLQYKKLGLADETRRNYRDFFTKQYNQQIAQLQQQISGNESLIKQISEQLKYSERLVTVDFELMQTGDLRVADLVLAINNYLSAKYLLTQTNISRLQLINQLNYWNR